MAALAAPLLEPAFPCGPIFHPVGPSVDGRDLYRQAVYRTLQDAIASGNAGAYRLARRKPADWDRAIDTKWAVMPSIVRRRWDAESRRTWPRAGEDIAVRVDPADVFCSLDEVYEVRRRPRRRRGRGQKREPRWDWTENHIRGRYREVYDALPWTSTAGPNGSRGRAEYDLQADLIDHARGHHPRWPQVQNQPSQLPAADNGSASLYPGGAEEKTDQFDLWKASGLPQSMHQWRWHKQLGGGNQGVAMLYRLRDPFNRTVRCIVVKREAFGGDGSNKERRLLRNLQSAGVSSKYLVKYLGEYRPPGPRRAARVYLEYAPYGDLDTLLNYYEAQRILVPEPFIWYLLGCILEALRVLATPVPPHKKAMFHYDIKLANILLGDVDQSRTSRHWFRHYPRPILADFGGVEELPAPDYIYACGAVGYQPFEALSLETQNLTNTWRRRPACNAVPALPVNAPKDTATSIHELGMVCWRAMSLLRPVALLQVPPTPQPFSLATLAGFARQAHPPRHGDDDRPTPPFAAGSTAATTATTTAGGHDAAADAAARRHMAPRGALAPAYSARLVECVYRMLAPVAAERPPLAQLAAEVAGAADGFARGAWAGPEAPQDWPPHPPLWPRGEGFARPRGVVVAWAKYPLGAAVLNDVYRP